MVQRELKRSKALVLFSGGLDSRLAIKLLQEKGIQVEAIFFKLPFGEGYCNDEKCVFNFAQLAGVQLHIIDLNKNKKLFQQYLNIIRNPRFGRGAGMNPCIDCRIFIINEAKKIAKKIGAEIIATGEVLRERPMSQYKRAFDIIERETKLKGKILRPLTDWEHIKGRQRKKQIQLAKKFRIKYPNPAGGCLLCDKNFAKKIKQFFRYKGISDITNIDINFLKVGRHFIINDVWVILGRDEQENTILRQLNKKAKYRLIEPDYPAPSALLLNLVKTDKKILDIVTKLIEAYSKKGNVRKRKSFEKWRV